MIKGNVDSPYKKSDSNLVYNFIMSFIAEWVEPDSIPACSKKKS